MDTIKKIVKLGFYDEFHCAGPDCKDTCCRYWHIDMSKREYLDYKKMKCSDSLRLAMDNSFKRKKDGTDLAYAEMKLDANGKCPLLGSDSLCSIQKELGEEALTHTCSVFPRLRMKVGTDTAMYSLSPTCCRVNELLIAHPEGLEIVEEEYDGKDRYINKDHFNAPRIRPDQKDFPYYWTILGAEIDILQNRSFTIQERMLILGYFCQKTDEYLKNDEMLKIAPLAEMILDNELCAKIAGSLKPKQSDERIAVTSVRILYKMYLIARSSFSAFVSQSFNRFMGKLGVTAVQIGNEEPSVNFNLEEYRRLTETFGKIMDERPYILENLLVDLIFSQNLKDGAWPNYFTLAVFYNTLKLCVPVFLKEEFTDEELAVAVTYAVKLVLNTNLAKGNIMLDSVLKKEYDLPHAVFLIC